MPTPHTDDVETLRFRGPTIESALDAAEKSLGGRVKLIAANRLRRGGFGGFFASDLGVEVVVSLENETIEEALQRLVEGTAAEEREEWRRQVAASAARVDRPPAGPTRFESVAAAVAASEIPPGASVVAPAASAASDAPVVGSSVESATESEFIEFLTVEMPTAAKRAGTNLDALAAAINGAKPMPVVVAAATKPAETEAAVATTATAVLNTAPKVVAAATKRARTKPKAIAAATDPATAEPEQEVLVGVIAHPETIPEIETPADVAALAELPGVVQSEPPPFKPSPVLLRRHVELAVAAAEELIEGLTHTPNVKSITARVVVRSGDQYEVDMEARWESHEEPKP